MWSVYKHIFPDGSVYYGITSLTPEARWDNGFGYESQRKLFKKIVKYGWNNISHEIVADGLDEFTARKMERELIKSAEHTRCNNTVFNRTPAVPGCVRSFRKWYDAPVKDGHGHSAAFVHDLRNDWLDNYEFKDKFEGKVGFFPLTYATEVKPGYVDLKYYEVDAEHNVGKSYIYRVKMPEGAITFMDYWGALMSGVKGDWVRGTHEPILEAEGE